MSYRAEKNSHNFQDYTGQRFGRLVCLTYEKVRTGSITKVVWSCACDCGAHIKAQAGNLRLGHTKSCGCLRRETTREARRTHGRSNTPEYEVWLQMIQRCTNSNNAGYSRYGARGIQVCQRWRKSFGAFLTDMGQRPSRDHSIERKNNNGNYTPKNCVWADRTTQNRNSRNVVLTLKMVHDVRGVRARGESVRAWASRNGVGYNTALRAARNESWGGGG